MTKNFNNQGFVILYAILMVSIVLTVSLSLLNISYKEVIISNTAADSQRAHYAAEAALNCAVFWDSYGGDGTPTADYRPFGGYGISEFQAGVRDEIICGDIEAEVDMVDGNSTHYWVVLGFPSGSCATVDVNKSGPEAVFLVNGYNIGDPSNDCQSSSPRQVERRLQSTTE